MQIKHGKSKSIVQRTTKRNERSGSFASVGSTMKVRPLPSAKAYVTGKAKFLQEDYEAALYRFAAVRQEQLASSIDLSGINFDSVKNGDFIPISALNRQDFQSQKNAIFQTHQSALQQNQLLQPALLQTSKLQQLKHQQQTFDLNKQMSVCSADNRTSGVESVLSMPEEIPIVSATKHLRSVNRISIIQSQPSSLCTITLPEKDQSLGKITSLVKTQKTPLYDKIEGMFENKIDNPDLKTLQMSRKVSVLDEVTTREDEFDHKNQQQELQALKDQHAIEIKELKDTHLKKIQQIEQRYQVDLNNLKREMERKDKENKIIIDQLNAQMQANANRHTFGRESNGFGPFDQENSGCLKENQVIQNTSHKRRDSASLQQLDQTVKEKDKLISELRQKLNDQNASIESLMKIIQDFKKKSTSTTTSTQLNKSVSQYVKNIIKNDSSKRLSSLRNENNQITPILSRTDSIKRQNSSKRHDSTKRQQTPKQKDHLNFQEKNLLSQKNKKKENKSQQQQQESYIKDLESKIQKSNKFSMTLIQKLKETESQLINLKQGSNEENFIYEPLQDDPVDVALSEQINNYFGQVKPKTLFIRIKEGLYEFGSKKLNIKLDKNNFIVISTDGNNTFHKFSEFLEKNYTVESNKDFEQLEDLSSISYQINNTKFDLFQDTLN